MSTEEVVNLKTTRYVDQSPTWPTDGRHVLAQYDEKSIVSYQAFRPSIGQFAVQHGHFGGDFSFNRMSWIKPNFLWMMYRSGWGTKPGQEVTLAVWLMRDFFNELLSQAVPSTYDQSQFPSCEVWQEAVATSSVRLQWDPDHDPSGAPLARRAIQLGLRGEALRKYAERGIVRIADISEFVASQRSNLLSGNHADLVTPVENVYPPPAWHQTHCQ